MNIKPQPNLVWLVWGNNLCPKFSTAVTTASAAFRQRRRKQPYGWRTGLISEGLGLFPSVTVTSLGSRKRIYGSVLNGMASREQQNCSKKYCLPGQQIKSSFHMIPSKTADWTMTFLGKEKHSESILYFFCCCCLYHRVKCWCINHFSCTLFTAICSDISKHWTVFIFRIAFILSSTLRTWGFPTFLPLVSTISFELRSTFPAP